MALKSTGIVREVDGLGRIVIPMELRKTMQIKPKDPLEIYYSKEGDMIVMSKYSPEESADTDAPLKSTGIVRDVDGLGRIVIPKELRKTLHIDSKDPLEIYVDGTSVILKKYKPACIFCDGAENVVTLNDHKICKDCIDKLIELSKNL